MDANPETIEKVLRVYLDSGQPRYARFPE